MIALIALAPLINSCQDDPLADLKKAAELVAKWASYKFTVQHEMVSTPGSKENVKIEGEFDESNALHFTAGPYEVYKKEKAVAIKVDGRWVKPATGRTSGLRRDDHAGGGELHEQEKAAQVPNFERISIPHDALKNLENVFTRLEKRKEGDGFIYSGEVSITGAAQLLAGFLPRSGGEKRAVASIWTDSAGEITRYEVALEFESDSQLPSSIVKAYRSASFRSRGLVEMKIPADAEKMLRQ